MRDYLFPHLSSASNAPMHGALADMPLPFFVLLFLAVVVATTVHEFGHAWMADRLGDPGPREQGRVRLSPLSHLDPLGTLILLVTMLIGFPVGWGRPVKTDPDLYKVDRRLGIALVAGAGPAMNLLTAIALAPIARFLIALIGGNPDPGVIAIYTFFAVAVTMLVNISLFFFNLIPIYPLDGSHITQSLLPTKLAQIYGQFMQRYGVFLFLGLIFTGVLDDLIAPLVMRLFLLLIGF